MSKIIRIGNLKGKKSQWIVVRPDRLTKGRIYWEAPRFASLSPEEAMALADRLVDLAEEIERAA